MHTYLFTDHLTRVDDWRRARRAAIGCKRAGIPARVIRASSADAAREMIREGE